VVTRRPLFRVYPEPCASTKPYEFDDRFVVVRGAQFLVDGNFVFPTERLWRDLVYRTLFGPCFAHTGAIYENSIHSLNLAVRRKFGLRLEPDDEMAFGRLSPDEKTQFPYVTRSQHKCYAHWLEANQREFLLSTDLVAVFAALYADCFGDYTYCLDMVERYHNDPHPKRLLRLHEWLERSAAGELLDDLWLESVNLKVKRDEWAKFVRILSKLKYPRAVGDFGVGASLQGAWLTDKLKCAQADRPIVYADGECWHVKSPCGEIINQAFENLLSPSRVWFFIAFSDDAVFAIRDGERVLWFNIDIASCDTGHTTELFEASTQLYPERIRADADVLVRQCATPVRVVSPLDKRDYVLLRRGAPTLSSGSTVTTSINTFASLLLGCTFGRLRTKTERAIRTAARIVGYDVSVERCNIFERVQFLKRSPVLCLDGVYRAVINLGVYLRLSGTCRGDLPGRGDLYLRARRFQAALVSGVFAGACSPLCDTLRASVADVTGHMGNADKLSKIVADHLYFVPDPLAICNFTDEAYLRRYDLGTHALSEITQLFASMGPGDHYASDTIERVLDADYGLACSYFDSGFLERENRTRARLANI